VRLIREPYTNAHAHLPADLICTRQTLEHIENPRDFAAMLGQRPGNRPEMVLFVEVPNLLFILRRLSIWDLIYEHPSIYNRLSLATLFRSAGFQPLAVDEVYGGQFLTLEARPAGGPAEPPGQGGESLAAEIDAFLFKFQEKLAAWHEILEGVRSAGKKAVIWGTGSKGVTFLNLLQPGEAILYAVDINPRKHGKFVAGAGQEIVPPEFLRTYRPDLIVMMNPIYAGEIRSTVEALGLQPEYLAA
jgi:hypothetical protein